MGVFGYLWRKLTGRGVHKRGGRHDSAKHRAASHAGNRAESAPRPPAGPGQAPRPPAGQGQPAQNADQSPAGGAAGASGRAPDCRILQEVRRQISGSADVLYHEFIAGGAVPCAAMYLEHMIDELAYRGDVMEPLLVSGFADSGTELYAKVAERRELPVNAQPATGADQVIDAILEGQIALFADGEERVMLLPIRKVIVRQIGEATNESVIRGPKEAFVEDIAANLTMIRRRIKSSSLKVQRLTLGRLTQSAVIIVYIDEICKQKLVDEVKLRMSRIDMDGVLSNHYIEEFIEDSPYSPFPQVIYTERPDTMAAALLEGRVGIICDGSPNPIIVPATLMMMMQSAEDYYQRFIAATWIRWIRFLFLTVSLLLPSLYIAVTTFHPEMLPHSLLITVAASRENVPFPAIVEAFAMEIAFEGLREAGLRIPKVIGQTVSIIGALIIGQAAVQAGLVSTPMVIVVSITGVASFIIPHYELGLAFRLMRFPIMLMATTFGLFGIIIAVFLLYLHLVTLRSFGTPYLAPIAPVITADLKDTLFRAPWWKMRTRPDLFGTKNRTRSGKQERPLSGEEEWD